ncbi:hypothetical protein INR49_024459 [Caranx melampygus]|nr:hypothetical protein INR49_024459 [Caranx melampygus]
MDRSCDSRFRLPGGMSVDMFHSAAAENYDYNHVHSGRRLQVEDSEGVLKQNWIRQVQLAFYGQRAEVQVVALADKMFWRHFWREHCMTYRQTVHVVIFTSNHCSSDMVQ